MSIAYHSGYRPPFPMFVVDLFSEYARVGPVTALLDTGADATLVPVLLLEEVKAPESGWATLRSHFGQFQPAQKYILDIEVNGMRLPGLYVVADEHGNDIILGRDVLNRLPIFLDGPQQQTDILDDMAAQRLRARRESGN